ncbi:MAG: proton-conducting transporter membrane subunit [Candidatus Hydrothermia bacterium]
MWNINLIAILIISGVLAFVSHYLNKGLKIAMVILGVTTSLVYALVNLRSGGTELINTGIFAFSFSINPLSYFFTILIIVIFTIPMIASLHEELDGTFYLFSFLTAAFAIASVMANDLLTLFAAFELMSLASFLIVLRGYLPDTHEIAFRYFMYSTFGAIFYLIGVFLKFYYSGNISFTDLSNLAVSQKILIFVTLALPFIIKIATMPFHNWAPDAYTTTPHSFTVFFSGGLSKVGVYGLAVLLLKIFPNLLRESFALSEILAWLGALTAALGGIFAFMSDDAKKLLAYSSISQLGYVLTGIALFTPYSFYAGIYHAVAHAVFESLLFLTVAGVIFRLGTSDLRKMGGLIKKMPVSFIGLLLGIIAGSGIPPTIGFAGKWLLYESAIMKGDLFLVSLLFFSSITAFLYSYKLVHSIFLGKLHKEHENVKEAPAGYVIGTIFLLIPLIYLGVFPGILMEKIYNFAAPVFGDSKFFTLDSVRTEIGFAKIPVAGITLISLFVISFLIYLISGKSYRARQEDNYTAGEWVDENFASHYAQEFYGFLRKAFGLVLKWRIEDLLKWLGNLIRLISEGLRRFYTGDARSYALYIIATFVIILFILGGRL